MIHILLKERVITDVFVIVPLGLKSIELLRGDINGKLALK